MEIANKAQLITYPDSLGGDLPSLLRLLETRFQETFCGVHILPPYPSSGDRGFAPTTYLEIEPSFGSWQDIRQIGEQFDVILDVMVNHISRRSEYFQDFARRGRSSPYADMFLTLDKLWPGGTPDPEDVAKIFLRRPEHPFADLRVEETGGVERVWATFGTRDWSEQIDLDINAPVTREMFRQILAHMSRNGVRMLRLDAIAFVTKKLGTSCFFVEPEIYEFLDWVQREADDIGLELLPELHSDFSLQMKLAQHGCWVYNFAIPLLVLHTLISKSGRALKDHLRECPSRQITMLDCHDGIPVQPDLDGLLDIDSAQQVVDVCLSRGANLNRILSPAHMRRPGFDAHQINITYYSALGASDDLYLSARAIQMFSPGIPQIYYVGLLAGENDLEEVEKTGERRAINRHNYSTAEVDAALERMVVRRLLRLIDFRNTHHAFNGVFQVEESSDQQVALSWRKGEDWCRLDVNLNTGKSTIQYSVPEGGTVTYEP